MLTSVFGASLRRKQRERWNGENPEDQNAQQQEQNPGDEAKEDGQGQSKAQHLEQAGSSNNSVDARNKGTEASTPRTDAAVGASQLVRSFGDTKLEASPPPSSSHASVWTGTTHHHSFRTALSLAGVAAAGSTIGSPRRIREVTATTAGYSHVDGACWEHARAATAATVATETKACAAGSGAAPGAARRHEVILDLSCGCIESLGAGDVDTLMACAWARIPQRTHSSRAAGASTQDGGTEEASSPPPVAERKAERTEDGAKEPPGATTQSASHVRAHAQTQTPVTASSMRCIGIDLSVNRIASTRTLGFGNSSQQLVALDLSANLLTSLDFPVPLRGLRYLYLEGNLLQNLQGLQGFDSLRHLDVSGNEVSGVAGLEGLHQLEHVDASANRITEIDALATCHSLRTLLLSDNRLSDLAPLEAASGLTALDVSSNNLRDLGAMCNALRQLPSLTDLVCQGNSCMVSNNARSREHLHGGLQSQQQGLKREEHRKEPGRWSGEEGGERAASRVAIIQASRSIQRLNHRVVTDFSRTQAVRQFVAAEVKEGTERVTAEYSRYIEDQRREFNKKTEDLSKEQQQASRVFQEYCTLMRQEMEAKIGKLHEGAREKMNHLSQQQPPQPSQECKAATTETDVVSTQSQPKNTEGTHDQEEGEEPETSGSADGNKRQQDTSEKGCAVSESKIVGPEIRDHAHDDHDSNI